MKKIANKSSNSLDKAAERREMRGKREKMCLCVLVRERARKMEGKMKKGFFSFQLEGEKIPYQILRKGRIEN